MLYFISTMVVYPTKLSFYPITPIFSTLHHIREKIVAGGNENIEGNKEKMIMMQRKGRKNIDIFPVK